MYKVFFNDRELFLTDDFSSNFQVRYGLFFKYKEEDDLEEIIDIYSKVSRINTLFIFHYDIEQLRNDFRKCFINIDAAGGVVKNNQDEYLLIYRRGKWDLPKGKLDKGENYQQAALREVEEETGLKGLTIERPLMSTYHTYAYKGKLALKKTNWFSMLYTGTEDPIPETEEDIEYIRWFKASELDEPFQNTFPLVIDIFRYLGVLD
jgi:8-oxo-dGTP pyrophosphatase MutT (NUDIX family)